LITDDHYDSLRCSYCNLALLLPYFAEVACKAAFTDSNEPADPVRGQVAPIDHSPHRFRRNVEPHGHFGDAEKSFPWLGRRVRFRRSIVRPVFEFWGIARRPSWGQGRFESVPDKVESLPRRLPCDRSNQTGQVVFAVSIDGRVFSANGSAAGHVRSLQPACVEAAAKLHIRALSEGAFRSKQAEAVVVGVTRPSTAKVWAWRNADWAKLVAIRVPTRDRLDQSDLGALPNSGRRPSSARPVTKGRGINSPIRVKGAEKPTIKGHEKNWQPVVTELLEARLFRLVPPKPAVDVKGWVALLTSMKSEKGGRPSICFRR
jgi:hypothetical protein